MNRLNTGSEEDREIEEAVFEVLEDILLRPRSEFRLVDQLGPDLKVDGDDFSFIFVPELEKKLKITVPVEE